MPRPWIVTRHDPIEKIDLNLWTRQARSAARWREPDYVGSVPSSRCISA